MAQLLIVIGLTALVFAAISIEVWWKDHAEGKRVAVATSGALLMFAGYMVASAVVPALYWAAIQAVFSHPVAAVAGLTTVLAAAAALARKRRPVNHSHRQPD